MKIVRYSFQNAAGVKQQFTLQLKEPELVIANPKRTTQSEWVKLDNNKCKVCPLNSKTNPLCPAALNLEEIISTFKYDKSFEKVLIKVDTKERGYFRKTDLQQGLSSLIGITMVSSGCPIMAKLRPMAFLHLPFATVNETVFKAISTYLMGQFLKKKNGKSPDWDMKGLVKIYEEIGSLNADFSNRLRAVKSEDASMNALVILDCFAKSASFEVEDNDFSEFTELFKPLVDIT